MRILLIIVFLSAVSHAWGTVAECDTEVGKEGATYGALYDIYSTKASRPDWHTLTTGYWKLTAIAPIENGLAGAYQNYDRTGCLIGNAVPVLEFMVRKDLERSGKFRQLLSWDTSRFFVQRQDWGQRNRHIEPDATNVPGWSDDAPLKRDSVTFTMHLHGENELFATGFEFPQRVPSYLQVYCRLTKTKELVCMAELWGVGPEGEPLFLTVPREDSDLVQNSGRIAMFFLFGKN